MKSKPTTGRYHSTLANPGEFYQQFNGVLLESGTAIEEVRSETRSLAQIFERMTS